MLGDIFRVIFLTFDLSLYDNSIGRTSNLETQGMKISQSHNRSSLEDYAKKMSATCNAPAYILSSLLKKCIF